MAINNEPEFIVTSGVGLLGESFKCNNKEDLLSYITENFTKSPNRLRITIKNNTETREFICLVKEGTITLHTESMGKHGMPQEKSIEESISLMLHLTETSRSKENATSKEIGIFKVVLGFVAFWVIVLFLADQFTPKPSETTQARRDCLASAALLAAKNNEADHFSDYARRCK